MTTRKTLIGLAAVVAVTALAASFAPGGLLRTSIADIPAPQGATDQDSSFPWGKASAPENDVPVPGDYDGDGKNDYAVWRQSDFRWLVKRSSDGQLFSSVPWGSVNAPYNDIAMQADYDGDGKTDPAVWRRADGKWYFLQSSQNYAPAQAIEWGSSAPEFDDTPISGVDYDGDGRADLTVWRKSPDPARNGHWYVLLSSKGYDRNVSGGYVDIAWGSTAAEFNDTPLSGIDYDGDGKTDLTVWRKSPDPARNGHWYVLLSSKGYDRNVSGGYVDIAWGSTASAYDDVPVPGDYDGDGKANLAVWRRANGTWYVKSPLSPTPTPTITPTPTPAQCAVQGTLCTTNADCGTCGATCVDAGTQNSNGVMIKHCTYLPAPNPACQATFWDGPQCQCKVPQRWNPVKNECDYACDYSNPPIGCHYEGGGTDPFTCDAQLVCPPEPSPTTFPYVSSEQVTCASCQPQGKQFACYDVSDPEHPYEQGFCSATEIAFTPENIMKRPDCTYCQPGPGVAWCPEDLQECPGGFKIGREGPDCEFRACPTERKFTLNFLKEPLRVGEKTNFGVCAVDQNGKIDTSYRGAVNIKFAAGPIGAETSYYTSILIFDKGCHTFAGLMRFAQPGLQTIRITSLDPRWVYTGVEAGQEYWEGTPETIVTKTVLPAVAPTPTPGCPLNQVMCNGQCYVGNCCSNANCSNGETCAVTATGNFCQGSTPTPTPLPSASPTPTPACLDGEKLCNGVCVPGAIVCVSPTPTPTNTPSPTPTVTPTPPATPTTSPSACPLVVQGDLHGDGNVDIADLAKLAAYLSGRITSL